MGSFYSECRLQYESDSSFECIKLNVGHQVIGRSAECDIVIRDPTVSRKHAAIVVTAEEILLADLQSRNGTFVNRTAVNRVTLRDSDYVRFGVVEFLVREIPAQLVRRIALEEESTKRLNDVDTKHPSPTISLSPARQRVLTCLLEGLSEKEIARKLDVSSHTVHKQIGDIYRQFELNSRAELLALFVRGRQ